MLNLLMTTILTAIFAAHCFGQTKSAEAVEGRVDMQVGAKGDEEEDTKSAYLAVYGDGLMSDYRVVEIVKVDFPKAKLSTELHNDTLTLLLARRGKLAALHHLVSTMSDEERQEFAKATTLRDNTGLTAMHYIVLNSKSAYWVDRFAELGVDVLVEAEPVAEGSFEELVRFHKPKNDTLESLTRYEELRKNAVRKIEDR